MISKSEAAGRLEDSAQSHPSDAPKSAVTEAVQSASCSLCDTSGRCTFACTSDATECPPEPLDTESFSDLSQPLRSHVQYIDAALSWYAGGPAGADVRLAWQAITTGILQLQCERADARACVAALLTPAGYNADRQPSPREEP